MLNRLIALAILVLAATSASASIVAGGTLDITEPVTGNLYVAGGTVTLGAPVAGNARIAGGHVEISKEAPVAKDLGIAGGDVSVKGRVAGNVRVAGGHVTIDAPVGGNVTVSAGSLELGPNARIAGQLRFRGGHLERDPEAQVVGGVVHSRGNRSWRGSPAGWVMGALWTLGLMLLAAIIAGALPGATRRMQEELATRPWLATLFGIVALICIPIAAVLVMITIIGIPLGLLALVAYVALIIVGYASASVVVSGLLLDRYKSEAAARTAWRVGAAVLAMLILSSLAHIPFVGGFVALAALVIGVGVIVAAMVHRKQAAPAAATA